MDENLKKQAEEIRDETKRGRNTAYRIGSFFLDLLKHISDPEGIPYAKSAKTDWKGNVIDETYIAKDSNQSIRKVTIKELDTLNSPVTAFGCYHVYDNTFHSGELIVMSDSSLHSIIQVLFGNYIINEEGIIIGHRDESISIMYRIYNLRSPNLPEIPRGTWGKWQKYGQKHQVLTETEYGALLNKNPDIFYYTYDEQEEVQ